MSPIRTSRVRNALGWPGDSAKWEVGGEAQGKGVHGRAAFEKSSLCWWITKTSERAGLVRKPAVLLAAALGWHSGPHSLAASHCPLGNITQRGSPADAK